MCPCLHPCILISLSFCVLAFNLLSSHPLIFRFMFSVCLLVPRIFTSSIPLGSCTLGACWYPRVLTSSYRLIHVFWVLVGILVFSYPRTLNIHFLLIKFSRVSYSVFTCIVCFQMLIKYLKANILHEWAALSRQSPRPL